MDTSFWTKLNPTVKFFPTNKLFYNKFLYKAKIYCPGSRIIYCKSLQELEYRLASRLNMPDISYNYGGSWWLTNQRESLKQHSNLDQLTYYYKIKNSDQTVKLRVEEPNIDIYANDEQYLHDLVSVKFPDRIKEIYKPSNSAAVSALLNGEIIANKRQEYDYKICVKRMFFNDITLKYSILDHLYNYDKEVKLPESFVHNLNSNRLFFPGGYFYLNDLRITTFIGMICPEFVSKIFKLTHLSAINI